MSMQPQLAYAILHVYFFNPVISDGEHHQAVGEWSK